MLKYVFVIGDEQTYDRMIKMKPASPRQYLWLIPIPGEFHVTGHILHCLYRLWWMHLLHPFSIILQRERIKMDWTMTKFNAHDDFVFIVVTAVHMWFEHCFGTGCLQNRRTHGTFVSQQLHIRPTLPVHALRWHALCDYPAVVAQVASCRP